MSVCVLVCRDCCCGTVEKHPDVDHAAQERVLREAAADALGKLIRTRCLDVCERSNVIVVKAERDTYWFGEVLRPDQLQRVAAFVRGAAPPPLELAFRKAPRRPRHCAQDCAANDCSLGALSSPDRSP